jgi:DNA-binding Xre family transcriptional regulator
MKMEHLIKRANDMCKKLNIDPNEVVEIKNLITTFRGSGSSIIVGTVIKYHKDTIPVYAVLTTSGWGKSWSYNGSKPDLVRVIRSMKDHSLSQKQIGEILGISQSQVSQLYRAKNIGHHEEGDVNE